MRFHAPSGANHTQRRRGSGGGGHSCHPERERGTWTGGRHETPTSDTPALQLPRSTLGMPARSIVRLQLIRVTRFFHSLLRGSGRRPCRLESPVVSVVPL